MTNEKLIEILRHFVEQSEFSLTRVRDALVEYKNSGGQQDNAQKIAEELRAQFSGDEVKEDRVLEILDIITSWCRPDLKVWN